MHQGLNQYFSNEIAGSDHDAWAGIDAHITTGLVETRVARASVKAIIFKKQIQARFGRRMKSASFLGDFLVNEYASHMP